MYKDATTGPLPKGCVQCLKGEKIVVFATGICKMKCFYCPISQRRKMVDSPFANERRIIGTKDLLFEAERMGAKGAGVTGGDPLYRLSRTIEYVRALKRRFGKSFHIHLYTTGELGTPDKFKKLFRAGVDEIRFHFNKNEILDALKLPWVVGGEIPAIPGNWKATTDYLEFLHKNNAGFCNLNELDWSEQNFEAFRKSGFKIKNRESYAVRGSEEFALKIVSWAKENTPGMPVHYCSSRTKDAVQIRKRFLRTAGRIRKSFEEIDSDGLLVKAVIEGRKAVPEIPKDLQFHNKKKKRVEFPKSLAKKLSGKYRVSIVSTTPTSEEVDMETAPIGRKFSGSN